MADTPVSPDEIKRIIDQASKEPGINDTKDFWTLCQKSVKLRVIDVC